jgi:hypothetical protein
MAHSLNTYCVNPNNTIFTKLPDELKRIVRKHTAASYAVDLHRKPTGQSAQNVEAKLKCLATKAEAPTLRRLAHLVDNTDSMYLELDTPVKINVYVDDNFKTCTEFTRRKYFYDLDCVLNFLDSIEPIRNWESLCIQATADNDTDEDPMPRGDRYAEPVPVDLDDPELNDLDQIVREDMLGMCPETMADRVPSRVWSFKIDLENEDYYPIIYHEN